MADSASKSKLTLWMDKETVRFGKQLAKQQHESLSGFFARYLDRLRTAGRGESLTPLVKKLSGVLKGRAADPGAYRKRLERKYLGA